MSDSLFTETKIYLGLTSAGLVALTITLAIAALTNRKRGDWTRRAFQWHFLAMILFWISIVLDIVFNAVFYQSESYNLIYIVPVGFAVEAAADLVYFAVLIQLLSGFKFARDGKKQDRFRIIHYLLLSVMLLLAAIVMIYAIVTFAKNPSGSNYFTQLAGAWNALFFLLCVDLFIFGIGFWRHAMAPKSHKFLLFGAIIVFLIRGLYGLIAAIVFSWVPLYTTASDDASYFGAAILDDWPLVLVSVLIVILGAKKQWIPSSEESVPLGSTGEEGHAPEQMQGLLHQAPFTSEPYTKQPQWAPSGYAPVSVHPLSGHPVASGAPPHAFGHHSAAHQPSQAAFNVLQDQQLQQQQQQQFQYQLSQP